MHIFKRTYQSLLHGHVFAFSIFVVLTSFFLFAGALVLANGQTLSPSDSHLVDLYVDDQQTSLPTRAATVGDFLTKAGVTLHEGDIVEPVAATPIDDNNFRIHVYRARPLTVIDGNTTKQILTAQSSPRLMAKEAGITLYPEDRATVTSPTNFTKESVIGERLTIKRATPVTISVYSAPSAPYRTHATTVRALLAEKAIVPEEGATVTPALDTKLTAGTAVFVSKSGVSITVVEEDVPFEIESTPDPTKQNGIVTVTTPGVKGKKQVVYERVVRGGKEIGRVKVQEVVTLQPQKQLQTRGSKPGNGLSKARGALVFTDSKGVMHRETYYDLPMSGVMKACGAGGQYSVRADGAKVDKDGYILVAANYNIYPRCSIVETSIGLGKVYDTGGFVLVHPHGFDLATDWSNNNGR